MSGEWALIPSRNRYIFHYYSSGQPKALCGANYVARGSSSVSRIEGAETCKRCLKYYENQQVTEDKNNVLTS